MNKTKAFFILHILPSLSAKMNPNANISYGKWIQVNNFCIDAFGFAVLMDSSFYLIFSLGISWLIIQHKKKETKNLKACLC